MPLLSRRRDPYWDVDGSAARRSRRKHGVVAVIAFATAVGAVLAAVVAWAGVMGMAPVGIPTVQIVPQPGDLGTRGSMAATGVVTILLFALVSTAAQARRPHVALAKLRGQSGAQVLRFALSEPFLVVAVAVPVGVVIAVSGAVGAHRDHGP